MGTLDPMATGVLPVAIGNAARLFDMFLKKRKTYTAYLTFGFETDTLDITGEVTARGGTLPEKQDIISVLPRFVGDISQLPPKYSAKSLGGRRAYELARSGESFELKPKTVTVYSLKLLGQSDEATFAVEVECGGGTYIRSLARDIGYALSSYCTLSSLKRTRSGVFGIDTAVKTSTLTEENIGNFIIPTQSILPFPSFCPSGAVAKKIFNGVTAECALGDGLYKLFCENGSFYGLAEVKNNCIKVKIKLC